MTTTEIRPIAPQILLRWPALAAPLIYGHHRKAWSVVHIWQPQPSPRAPARHKLLCGMVMAEAPRRPGGEGTLTLCSTCRAGAVDPSAADDLRRHVCEPDETLGALPDLSGGGRVADTCPSGGRSRCA